jgi:hypothetical protein
MKSESWLIVQFGAALLALGLLSFFVVPAYEKGAWAIMTGFLTAMGTVMGYKFGRSMPQQSTDAKPGQTSQVQTSISNTPDPPVEEPKP